MTPLLALPPRRRDILAGAALLASLAALGGCATAPQLGQGGNFASGSAGGSTSAGAAGELQRCDRSLGTIGIQEDTSAPWFGYLSSYRLNSTVPVLRLIIQQSNCFVIVERGRSFGNVMAERGLARSGEIRRGSNFGGGQMVAADYTMSPSINFSQAGTQGLGAVAGFIPVVGGVLGGLAGSTRANDASTTLLLIDNRSGVQLAAAEGSARNWDIGGLGALFGGGGGGAVGGYSSTPEGRVLSAAFVDSYNKLVETVRNYQAQTVRGGLGTGGELGVQGGTTPASRRIR